MKKLILLLIVIFAFSGCFLQNKKTEVLITNNGSDKIDTTIEGGALSYGTVLEVPLISKSEIEGTSFDISIDKSKLELVDIQKLGFSEENIVVSYDETFGYKIVAYDLKNKIKPDTVFLNLYFKVKGSGSATIAIENVKIK